MKKKLFVLFYVGMLSAWTPVGAMAATGDELARVVDSYFAGKISSEEVLSYLSTEAVSTENTGTVKSVALLNQAIVLRSKNDATGAYTAAREAIKLDPMMVVGYHIIASLDAAAGKFEDAIAGIDKALANAGGKNEELEKWKREYQFAASAIDAVEFHKEFQSNLFAAEEKYKGKQIPIIGTVEHIKRAMNGNPVITMTVGLFKEIEIEMDKEDIPFISKISKGNKIIVFVRLKRGGNAIVEVKGFPFIP